MNAAAAHPLEIVEPRHLDCRSRLRRGGAHRSRIGGYVFVRLVTGDRSAAEMDCPSGDFVGEQLRSRVFGPTDADLLVISGCYYSNDVYEVYVTTGSTLGTDQDQIESMVDEGEAAGVEVESRDASVPDLSEPAVAILKRVVR